MRTAEAIRARLIEDIAMTVRCPAMWAHDGSFIELMMMQLLKTLCFIDERDHEWLDSRKNLEARRQFSCAGVRGSFESWVGTKGRFPRNLDEVASVYAGVAYQLGYLSIQSPMPGAAFRKMRRGLRKSCRARDWRQGEVTERFGPPSPEIGWISAYVSGEDPRDWIFFDFLRPFDGGLDDLPLLGVRIPAREFPRELAFTPLGLRMRDDPDEGALQSRR